MGNQFAISFNTYLNNSYISWDKVLNNGLKLNLGIIKIRDLYKWFGGELTVCMIS